ncbi:redoxin family protein [Sphingobacterium zeae]|uniref:redoxin family protein n=1 Tax=Sphingobacterium zeae TaxID=1776859 RepID=UPI0036071CFD
MRKKIRQGKTYFTGTSILLKKRCKNSVQNQIKIAGSSGSLRLLFEDPSTLRRTNVAPSSGVLRLLFGCSSGRTRSAAEAVPKPSRSVAEHVSNMSRRSPEAKPKATRRGVGALLSSDFCLTNFALTSAFHAIGLGCSSAVPLIFPEGDPKPTRRNPEQRWEKGRSWSGIDRYLNGLFLGTKDTVSSPLSYRECTERVPKRYWKGTKELPKIYQRGTEQVRAVSSSLVDLGYKSDSATAQAAKGEDTGLHNGREGSCFKFNAFKAFYERIVSNVSSFIVDGISKGQRALKHLVCLFDNKSTSRMSLTCLALVFQSSNYSFKVLKSIRALALSALMVSMFSLSAQTPRKDSGADGPTPIKALNIGDKIPQSLWDTPLEVVNHPTGQKTIKLSEYRDKRLIILDFWATWCGSCVESLGKIQHMLKYDQSEIVFIPVTFQSDAVVSKFQQGNNIAQQWQFPLVVGDKLLKQLFSHATISHFVWIDGNGTVKAFTSSEYITDTQLQRGLSNDFAQVKMKIDQIDFDPKQPLLIPELADLKARYTGFRGSLAGVAPTSGMQNLDSLGLKRRYFVNATLRTLCMDAMSDIQGVQLAKKKIVYEVVDENRYFNKEQVNADVYIQQYGLCYEAVLPIESTTGAFRETLRNDLWQHFKIKLAIEERKVPVIAFYGNNRKSHVSKGETIALKTLIDKLNVRDNDIPYLICPADLQNLHVPSNLKDCTSTKLLIERLAQSGIKADQRKENLAVLVISERRGA